MARRSARSRLLPAVLALLVMAPQAVAALPSDVVEVDAPPATAPNTVDAIRARPAAPIDLEPSGGGFVAAGPTSTRVEPAPVARPARATEIVSLRTEHSTVIQNPDGTFSKAISLGRLNYRDAGGAWQPIDVRLVDDAKGGYDQRSAANDLDVRTSVDLGSERVVELAAGAYRLRIRVPGLAGGSVEAARDRLAFTGLGKDPGFEILPTPEGFEFRATIGSAESRPEIRVALEPVGLTPTMDGGGTIWLATAKGERVGRISAPVVVDAAGEYAPPDAVTAELITAPVDSPIRPDLLALASEVALPTDPTIVAALSEEQNRVRLGEVVAHYAVDPKWLADPARVFPVVIDPTACIRYGGATGCTINGGNPGVRDVWVTQAQPNTSPTTEPLKIGYDTATWGTTRTEIYFPDVALPDGALVTSADLRVVTLGGYAARQVMVGPLSAPWPFGNGTWNNQPPTITSLTQGPFTPPAVAGTFTMDLSPIVRAWYTRNPNDWKPDSGVKLWLQDETSPCPSGSACERMLIYAGINATTANRPLLTINYDLHQARLDFDGALGTDFAPSTMPAGQTITLPVVLKNQGSPITFNKCASGVTTNCYRVGYRWFDSTGMMVNIAGFTASGSADLLADIASGGTSATIDLPVVAPPNAGQYTLRTDLIRMWNNTFVFASDYADPSKYFARAKDPLAAPSNVRWVGTSVVARSEFPIAVVPGGGTAVGETKSVPLPDGSELGINLWSRNLRFDGPAGMEIVDLGRRVSLEYFYDSAHRTDCTSSILLSCGWATNFDEAFLPGSNGADWIYRDPQGNRFAVDATSSGQLVSGAGAQLDRYRATLVEDNNLPGWTGGAVTRTTAQAYAGAASLSISTSATASTSYGFPAIDASHFILGSFAAKATGATGVGIGFHIKNQSTGTSGWLYYTLGTDLAVSGATKIALGGSVATWNHVFQRSVLFDLYSNGFGTSSNRYLIDGIQLRGNGTAGTAYFDSVRFEGRSSQIFSDWSASQPAWSANPGGASANTTDKVVGANSIQIAPATIGSSPTCGGCLLGALNAYPYLRWAWKKVGGSTVAIVVHPKDLRTGVTGTLTYYAGSTPPAGAVNPIQIASTIPDHWIYVTRNLLEDARQVLNFYNDHDTLGTSSAPSGGPTPNDVQLTGYSLVASDGAYALFDDGLIRTMPQLGDQYGLTTGDEFAVTNLGGEQHRFDREGRLIALRDRDANSTALVWSYDPSGLAESLATIRLPSDGQGLASGTAQREIAVTYPSNAVRFTEQLGSTTSAVGRYMEFGRTAAGDLATVVPARRSAACASSGASGCQKFDYTDATGHYLYHVYDPRFDGANANYMTIGYAGADPISVTAAATGGLLLRILSNDTDAGWRLRPRYQDVAGTATGTNGFARHDDLSPNGSVLVEYAPVACTAAACAAAPAPLDKLIDYTVDGIDNYASEVRYRTTGSGDSVTSRRGTYAAAKVDNFSDPLTAGLTAWTQTADQYAASVAAGNVNLYRTDYTYDELGRQTAAASPFTNPAGGTSTQTVRTAYDAEGHPTQVADPGFIANPGFEGQTSGWSGTGTWTQTAPYVGVGALMLSGTQTGYQSALLLPGETFRFQAAIKAASGSSTGYTIEYEKPGGTYSALLALTSDPVTTWKVVSYDVTIPQGGTGRVRLTFSVGAGSGTAYVDEVAVFTRFATTAYLTDGRVDSETDVLGRVTKYGYGAGVTLPAILPTTITANYVSGQSATADRNVSSSASYDAWGRAIVGIDPDGVVSTTTYAANLTDVASVADGLVNTTSFLYDEVGNRTRVTDPLNRVTTTTYSYLGDPVDVTAPDSVTTRFGYDAVGRATSIIANYTNGGSGTAGVANVKTGRTYDAYGNVTQEIADQGGGLGSSDAYTNTTYDLFGQPIAVTVYENAQSTGARTVTSYFDTAGRPAGTRGPIDPTSTSSPLCPQQASTRCNELRALDWNDRATVITDAYGKVTRIWYDFAGKPIREIRNFVDGIYSASVPDTDVITSSAYDTADRLISFTDPLARVTSTTFDNLDRVTLVTRPDSSWVKTAYLASGRIDRESRPGASGQSDSQVGWTKRVYDAAGRQTTTLLDFDTSDGAQYSLTTFESGTGEGFTTASNVFIATGATLSTATGPATGRYARRIVTSAATKNQGVSLPLSGTFLAGHTYQATVYASGSTAGQAWGVYLGFPAASSYGEANFTSTGSGWQRLDLTWTPTSTYASGVVIAFRGNREQFSANTVTIDDVQVWDTASPTRHAPSVTAFDAAGQVIASVAPPAKAGEAPQVTGSTYDTAGRLSAVSVNQIDGAGTSAPDVNLTTSYAYDALGDQTDATDPGGTVSHYAFDRGGRITAATQNYIAGNPGSTATINVTSKLAYNDRGELTARCTARQVQADACDPTAAPTSSWRYTYDAAGHVLTETPPTNVGTALATTTNFYDTASGGARLTSSCDATGSGACTTPLRHTDLTYDALGRLTQSIIHQGAGTASPKIRTLSTYDGAGQRAALDRFENGSASAADALSFGFDLLGRETTVSRSGAPITTSTYNPDGSVATRKDHAISSTAATFGYDLRGNLVSVTSPLTAGATTFSWRLDGLLDARSWPTGTNSGTFAYDGAKRPIGLSEKQGAATLAFFGRTYDRGGTVTSETQALTGITGDAGGGTQTFSYDPLDRVTQATIGATTKSYAYDADSNRVSQTENGVVATFAFDRTGAPRTLTIDGVAANYVSDGYGNLTSSVVPATPAPDTIAPSTPGGLTATALGDTTIGLSWTAATDNVAVSAYAIERDGSPLIVVAGSAIAFTDRSAAPGTAYTYRIRALDAAGLQSALSASAGATTSGSPADSTPPSTPTGLSASAVGTRIDLAWTASTDNVGVTKYRIFRGGTYLTQVAAGTTAWSDTGLTSATAYSYTVAAVDAAANESAQSTSAGATTSGGGGGSISVRASSSGVYDVSSTTAVVVSKPSGTLDGDYLVVAIHQTIAQTTLTPPTGWTELTGSPIDGSTTQRTRVFSRTAAAEPASWTFTSSAGARFAWGAIALANPDPTTPLHASATLALAATGSPTGPAVTTSVAGALLLDLKTSRALTGGTVAWTPPTGFTEQLDVSTGSTGTNGGLTIASLVAAAAGSQGGFSSTVSPGTERVQTALIAVAPGPGGGAPPPDTTPPTVPTGLGLTVVDNHRLDLAWTASTDTVGVQGYRIYRDGTLLTTVGSNAWSDTGLAPATAYSYTVAAVDAAANESAQSTSAGATTSGGGGGSISVRASSSGVYDVSSTTAVVVSKPSGTLDGDYLVVAIHQTIAQTTLTPPTGWTELTGSPIDGSTTQRTRVFSRTAAAEPASWTFTSSAGARFAWGAIALANPDPTTPLHASATLALAATGSPTGPAVTTSVAGALLLDLKTSRALTGGTVAWTPPTGFTEQLDVSTGSTGTNGGLTIASLVAAAAGSQGGFSSTVSPGTERVQTALIAVAPGPGGGAPPPDTTPPTVPTGLGLTVVDNHRLDLAWTASTDTVGVQGYRIYRDGTLVATTGSPTYVDGGLASGSAHSYTVAAIDGAGNASAQSTSANGTTAIPPVTSTGYAYDLADRLTGITPTSGSATSFTIDALGRHKAKTAAGVTDTYAYVGSSEVIAKITPSTGASTSSIVDPTGARTAVSTSSGGFGWTLSDLHGNSAGYATLGGGVISDARRYDPYGETLASVSSGLARPWGYQGRLLLSASGDAELYDFVFRAYVPDLGAFSSPDDLAGSALDPITFNRYLYAGADPATLVDPDGHAFVNRNLYDGGAPGSVRAGTSGPSPARQAAARKAEARVTSRTPSRSVPVKGPSRVRVNRALAADLQMAGAGRDAWLRTEASQRAEFGRAAQLGTSPLGEFVEGFAQGAPIGLAAGAACALSGPLCLGIGGIGLASAGLAVANGESLVPSDARGWGSLAGGFSGGWAGYRGAGAAKTLPATWPADSWLAPAPGKVLTIPSGSAGGAGAGARISSGIRLQYFASDRVPPLCSYCRANPAQQVDHVIARSQGGDLTGANLAPACGWCNRSKSDRPAPANPPPGFTGSWPPEWWPERIVNWWTVTYRGN
ncbi:MAG: RHS repeat-associated core domain-containing protein [Chloroflexota bacterium]